MVVILCSAPPAEADVLARALVNERLAACVTLQASRSIYRWDGKVVDEEEALMLIKTSRAMAPTLSDRLRELHSYDTPEIVVLAADAALTDPRYAAWVQEMTR